MSILGYSGPPMGRPRGLARLWRALRRLPYLGGRILGSLLDL